MAPTSRMAEAWLGKIPVTRDRRLISLLMRSKGLAGPDLLPVRSGERGEGQHVGFDVGHQGSGLWEAGGELVLYLVPGAVDGLGVGLGEDGPEHRRGHVLVGLGHHRQQVADEVHPAALAGCALEPAACGRREPSVGVGDDQAHAAEAPVAQIAQELLPEPLALAVVDVAAQHLPAPV